MAPNSSKIEWGIFSKHDHSLQCLLSNKVKNKKEGEKHAFLTIEYVKAIKVVK